MHPTRPISPNGDPPTQKDFMHSWLVSECRFPYAPVFFVPFCFHCEVAPVVWTLLHLLEAFWQRSFCSCTFGALSITYPLHGSLILERCSIKCYHDMCNMFLIACNISSLICVSHYISEARCAENWRRKHTKHRLWAPNCVHLRTAKKQDETQALTTKNNDLEGTPRFFSVLSFFPCWSPVGGVHGLHGFSSKSWLYARFEIEIGPWETCPLRGSESQN